MTDAPSPATVQELLLEEQKIPNLHLNDFHVLPNYPLITHLPVITRLQTKHAPKFIRLQPTIILENVLNDYTKIPVQYLKTMHYEYKYLIRFILSIKVQ